MNHTSVEDLASTDAGKARNRPSVWLVACALIAAFVFNKWSLERIVAADEHIGSVTAITLIALGQAMLVVLAILGWLKRESIDRRPRAACLVILALTGAIGVGIYGNLRALHIIDPNRETRLAWKQVIKNEELLLALTPRLKLLNAGVLDLALPDHESLELFDSSVEIVDIAEYPGEPLPLRVSGTQSLHWPAAERSEIRANQELTLWKALFERVNHFENAKFKFIQGKFESETSYWSELGFWGQARMLSGEVSHVHGTQIVRWRLAAGADGSKPEHWRIYDWRSDGFELEQSSELFFEEVLDRVASAADVAAARRSIHEEYVTEFLSDKDNFKAPHELFSLVSFDRHPGVSVVDINGDGLDDFYLMARWGKNQLFVNRGDGTYEDRAADYGLDVDGRSSSAIFADFDNDGDPDLMLGRTLERSQYFVNRNGRFVEGKGSIADGALPFFVSSVSATDYDGDGLLDVYFSTYAADNMRTRKDVRKLQNFLKTYLSTKDAETLTRLKKDPQSHDNLRLPGPPNVLLRNAGSGRFELVESSELRLFFNTYQSTWADYDGDGDQDVYVANDFAPNQLMRNDGNGRFVDVTDETGTADIGFGMGATWADYDEDGSQDLYVTNMYSKAGKRITSQLPNLDKRFAKMAGGNTLFRNLPGSFEKVSGLAPPALTVEKAGWGWGAQFLDVNNDGALDIYSLSGYYSAPGEHELPIDI